MTASRIAFSSLSWAALALLFGSGVGYAAQSHPLFCSRLPTFCALPPTGYGFWSVGICALLLLYGCVDLLRLVVGVLHRTDEIAPPDQLRLKFAIWQTVAGGTGLLLLLLVGFMNAAGLHAGP
jgi:hypothetical protein